MISHNRNPFTDPYTPEENAALDRTLRESLAAHPNVPDLEEISMPKVSPKDLTTHSGLAPQPASPIDQAASIDYSHSARALAAEALLKTAITIMQETAKQIKEAVLLLGMKP